MLSHFAWAVLDQLGGGGVWDGDLVSKQGRTDLVNHGYAERVAGRGDRLATNRLTPKGQTLLAQVASQSSRTRQ